MTVTEYAKADLIQVLEEQWGLHDLELNEQELVSMAHGFDDAVLRVNTWLRRGDGVAVYENVDLGHPMLGHKQIVSFGGSESMLPSELCPRCCGKLEPVHLEPVVTERMDRYCGNSACSGHDGVPYEETQRPPQRLPDFPKQLNYRYYLQGTYRGEEL